MAQRGQLGRGGFRSQRSRSLAPLGMTAQPLTEKYMRSLIACSAIALGVALSTAAGQDIQRDILAGHITGPSGAVAGALVSVTVVDSTSPRAPLVARTDVEGRWLVAAQE